MCGIAGFAGRQDAGGFRLARMVESLAGRGPDGFGQWCSDSGDVGLGHTRLSIIDLSDAARQPMVSRDGRFRISYNGEIYNFRTIRANLEELGHRFRTESDTEALLLGWAEWGRGVLTRVRGMFAFAIWDSEHRQLALCRDRMGIKPLLYAPVAGKGIVFASTLKAILASGLVEPLLDPEAVFELLATGSVCQPRTMIKGVSSVEPGSCLVWKPGQDEPELVRYWSLVEEVDRLRPQLAGVSYADAVRLVRHLLEVACRYHLVADVPVGSFLSGGVDSTALTAILSRHSPGSFKSFSIGFEDQIDLSNELPDAKLAATHIGTDHVEVIVSGRDVDASFDEFVSMIDQPSYDGLNTFLVSRAARQAVKVAVSGLGGDELFAGYGHFACFRNAAGSDFFGIQSLLSRVHRLLPNRITSFAAQCHAARQMSLPERYAQLRRGLTDAEIHRVASDALRQHFAPGFVERWVRGVLSETEDSVTQTSLVECRHYLLNTLLRDADALSMGQGLEVRPVMLDHPLVEHAIALPAEFKLRNGRHKAVLKDAVADVLPPELLSRRKTGFTLPTGRWLRSNLRPRLESALTGRAARSLFSSAFLAESLAQIDNPAWARTLWTVLVLSAWVEDSRVEVPS